jgi:hypothetical protein
MGTQEVRQAESCQMDGSDHQSRKDPIKQVQELIEDHWMIAETQRPIATRMKNGKTITSSAELGIRQDLANRSWSLSKGDMSRQVLSRSIL